MRLFVAVLVVLTLLVSDALAIMRVRDTWDYGVKGGVTFTHLRDLPQGDEETKTGFAGGVFFEYKASPNFSIQPELLYVMKGWGMLVDADEDGSNDKTTLSYLEVPLLLKYKIAISDSFNPNIFAGPSGAVLLNANSQGVDMNEFFQSVDYGLAFGVGADVITGTGKIVFDFRYTLGLKSIIDHEEYWDLREGEEDIKNAAMSFSIGYGW